LRGDPVLLSILIASLVFVAGFLQNDYGEISSPSRRRRQ
jgi:hypothetical protein